jgi:hypothetical protein
MMIQRVSCMVFSILTFVRCASAAPAQQVDLRGFGHATIHTEARANHVQITTIEAESEAKAALWHAKYLSDLTNTIGRATPLQLASVTAYALNGHPGFALAVRKGRTLQLCTASTQPQIAALAQEYGATQANTHSTAVIPLYLNEWDQHAFRAYYWTGQTKPGEKNYDARQDFDFARSPDPMGVIFWTGPHRADRAEGIADNNQWNWAFEAASQRKVPITLNLTVGESTSIANAYRDEVMRHAPDFAGTYLRLLQPGPAGANMLSWGSDLGRHQCLTTLQDTVKRYNTEQVTTLLEPHGELNHGDWTWLIEHGPVADTSFRAFLKERFGSLAAVAKRHEQPYSAWEDIHLPEVADFAGWKPGVLDLAGSWRVHYLPLPEGKTANYNFDNNLQAAQPASPEFFNAAFDDSTWATIPRMPGSDENLFLPKQPAVVRRSFAWTPRAGRFWLYLWDLNMCFKQEVVVAVNGKEAGRDAIAFNTPHWMSCEVTDLLRSGNNQLAIQLPNGCIGYRIYISDQEPQLYPHFTRAKNALWTDFSDWQGWSRAKAVEQGLAMIREVEPNKSIISMAPDSYITQLRELCRRFGARFHNTGYMGCCHAEYLPMLMRSAGMPFSLEPGGPADDLPGFKRLMGYYLSSSVNAIHYFIHIGCILWNDDIRNHFHKIYPALRMMGQYHQPQSEAAILFDSDANMLLGYPWRKASNAAGSGFWEWRFPETLIADYPTDGIIPIDFSNTLADRYKVVIDSNTAMLRPETATAIGEWVKRGGVFVAMFESGRHTPEQPDAWALQSISGVKPACFSRYGGLRNEPQEKTVLRRETTATLFKSAPREIKGDGARLENLAADVQTLYTWADGTPAVTLRPYGKGSVITFGVRLLPFGENHVRTLLCDVLAWSKVKPLLIDVPRPFHPKHYVSNNGLSDIFVLWNNSNETKPYSFTYRDGQSRALTDVVTGKPATTSGELGPLDFLMVSAPRKDISDATEIWTHIQCGYWQGTEKSSFQSQQKDRSGFGDNVLALDGLWRINGAEKPLTSWTPDTVGTNLFFVAEKTFTIPSAWRNGDIHLWCVGLYTSHVNIPGSARFLLNNQEIANPGRNGGVAGLQLALKPGETATLRMEITNADDRCIRGLAGNCFLSFTPTPATKLDLSGPWQMRRDVVSAVENTQTLPGRVEGAFFQRTFTLPRQQEGERVVLHMVNTGDLIGALINGHYVRRNHHVFGEITHLDITPWIKPNATNEIVLCGLNNASDRKADIRSVELYLYPAKKQSWFRRLFSRGSP